MIDHSAHFAGTTIADGSAVSLGRLTLRCVALCHVELIGELDLESAPLLTAAFDTIASGGTTVTVTVDVAGVTFVDSSGLSALIGAGRQLGPHRRLTLLWPTRATRRLLGISGLTEHLLGHDQRTADRL